MVGSLVGLFAWYPEVQLRNTIFATAASLAIPGAQRQQKHYKKRQTMCAKTAM